MAPVRGLLAIVLAVWMSPVLCADKHGQYRVHAVAKVAGCAGLNRAVVKAKDENDWGELYGYSLYTMGYLTGVSRLAPNTYDIAGGKNSKNVMLWLRGYCSDHPLDSFDRALLLLTGELYPARTREVPRQISPTVAK